MDKKNKIFFIVAFLLLFGSIGATYLRIVVFKNYIVETQTDCDPETEKCFIWECDPESSVEGEACTGDEEQDIWYYQLIRRKAYNVLLCNPDEDENLSADESGCDPMECDVETEKGCEIVFCNDETKIEQEVECSDPVEYLLNNPVEEEEKNSKKKGKKMKKSKEKLRKLKKLKEKMGKNSVENKADASANEKEGEEEGEDIAEGEDEKSTTDGDETENKEEETKTQETIN